MEAAIYWAAVGLIVCDGLSMQQAAERLGVDREHLHEILVRRQAARPYVPSTYALTRPISATPPPTSS
jgi:hypothetical protein